MKKIILFFFFTVIIWPVAAQIQWQKSLGGSGSEAAYSICQTADSGYVIAGTSNFASGDVTINHGNYDYWILKTSTVGNIQWQKSLGGSGSEIPNAIGQTFDGGYIVAGYSNSNDGDVSGNHGSYDFWIVKLGHSGSIEWQRSLGGTGDDIATSIQQTTDSGYIIAGTTGSNDGDVTGLHGIANYWVVKLSSSGNIQWQKCYGGSIDDEAKYIQQTRDSGFIVTGFTSSNNVDVSGNHGAWDYWVVKLSDTGGIQWQKCLGGSGLDEGNSIEQTTDGGYIVAGNGGISGGDITDNHGMDDCWIVKLSSTGSLQWEKSLGGSGNENAKSIQQTADSGYIIAGTTDLNNGDVTGFHGVIDYWIVKLSTTGNLLWEKCFGGSDDDEAYFIRQTFEGGYIVAGYTVSNDGDVLTNHGESDCWILKLGTDTGEYIVNNNKDISIYPNPTRSDVCISDAGKPNIEVYSVVGQLIKKASNTDHISLAEFSPGIYFIKVFNQQGQLLYHSKITRI